MVKNASRFTCIECGYISSKWMGKCPSCDSWNTLIEDIPTRFSDKKRKVSNAVTLNSIEDTDVYRYSSGISELDRVLGGGIVPGSLVLLGGHPGIGKSTLLLQVADYIAGNGNRVIYLSGEESLKQIRIRSQRLNIKGENIYLVNEQNIDTIEHYIEEINPEIIIIDSIQTVYSDNTASIAGSISQLKESALRIMEIAKKREKAFFLVGHVTKEGAIAGPKVLEHMVDVVVSFEGDMNLPYRLLRGIKNRFGPTDEIGLLEMSGKGLMEVLNPSGFFLSSYEEGTDGLAQAAIYEGTRPFLIEVQALVSSSSGPGYSRRMASGIDQNRLALIVAILEKNRGYNFAAYDIFIKVTGGLFLKDPAADLSIAAAVVSSYVEKPLPSGMICVGELGLSGQIRPIPFMSARLKEIEKLGYKHVVVPAGSRLEENNTQLDIIYVKDINTFLNYVTEE